MASYTPKDPLLWRIMGHAPGLLGCIVLLLCIPVQILLFPFWLARQWARNAYFDGTLKEQGRVIPWDEFVELTKDGTGTIVIEVGMKRHSRFWWSCGNFPSTNAGAIPQPRRCRGHVLRCEVCLVPFQLNDFRACGV